MIIFSLQSFIPPKITEDGWETAEVLPCKGAVPAGFIDTFIANSFILLFGVYEQTNDPTLYDIETPQQQQQQLQDIGMIIEIPALTKHTHSLIFLHGLGDTGHGWSSTFKYFHKHFAHFKLIFPTAPVQPVTLNGGFRMNSWYDIRSLDICGERDVDFEGLEKSSRLLEDLVAKEVSSGIKAENVVIGGFSQGGAVTLFTLLKSKMKVGAGVALSTYLASPTLVDECKKSCVNSNVPVFMAHGTYDQVVKYDYGKMSFEKLKEAFGDNVKFHSYEGLEHSSNDQELMDIFKFLQTV